MAGATDQAGLVTSVHDLAKLGLDPYQFHQMGNTYEWHGECPFCGGDDRFLISNGMVRCRVCGFGSTYLGLAKKQGAQIDTEEFKEAAQDFEQQRKVDQQRSEQERIEKIKALGTPTGGEKNIAMVHHKALLKNPMIRIALEGEGISKTAIEKFEIGYVSDFRYFHDGQFYESGGVTFPIYQPGTNRLMNIRIRLTDPVDGAGKYRPIQTGLGAGFFVADFPENRFVVVTEGEKKAIVFWQYGIPAIGLWGIEVFKDEWIPWFKRRYDEIYICYDREINENVLRAQQKIAEKIDAHVVLLPVPGKPDDLLISGEMTIFDFLESLYNARRL